MKKKKIASSNDSFGEEAIVKAEGGFIGLVSHAPCEIYLRCSLVKVTVKMKRG